MSIIVALFSLVVLFFIGYSIIYFFDINQKHPFIEKLGVSYGIGVGIISLQLFIFSILHIPWNKITILLPWIIIFSVILLKKRKLKIKLLFNYHFSIIETILLVLLSLSVMYVIFEGSIRPVDSWDAWANWFLGGKAFYIDGFVNPQYIIYANNSNPPGINLLVTFIYIMLGSTNDSLALLPFICFYVALVFTFVGALKTRTNLLTALLFGFLLASTQNFIRHGGKYDVGDSDLAVGYFFLVTVLQLLEYIKDKSKKNLVITSMLAGMCTFISSEGLPFFFIIEFVLLYIIVKRKKNILIILALFGAVIPALWEIFVYLFHLPQNPFVRTTVNIFRVSSILLAMMKELINVERWNLLWIVFFASMFSKLLNREVKLTILIITLQWFVYIGVYMMTPWDPVVHIENSFDRLLLHLAPLALFCTSIILYQVLKKYTKLPAGFIKF